MTQDASAIAEGSPAKRRAGGRGNRHPDLAGRAHAGQRSLMTEDTFDKPATLFTADIWESRLGLASLLFAHSEPVLSRIVAQPRLSDPGTVPSVFPARRAAPSCSGPAQNRIAAIKLYCGLTGAGHGRQKRLSSRCKNPSVAAAFHDRDYNRRKTLFIRCLKAWSKRR
jgi:hypothetical protein